MFKRTLVAAVVLAATAGPALAGHCPRDVKAIDAALKGSTISKAQMSEVKKLRDKGAHQHDAGKHGESLKALHKAMGILGIKH